jgi:hypothetical protein
VSPAFTDPIVVGESWVLNLILLYELKSRVQSVLLLLRLTGLFVDCDHPIFHNRLNFSVGSITLQDMLFDRRCSRGIKHRAPSRGCGTFDYLGSKRNMFSHFKGDTDSLAQTWLALDPLYPGLRTIRNAESRAFFEATLVMVDEFYDMIIPLWQELGTL